MMCIIARLNARLIAKRLFHLNEWFFAFHPHTHIGNRTISYTLSIHRMAFVHISTPKHTHTHTHIIRSYNCNHQFHAFSMATPRISYSNRINESLLTVYINCFTVWFHLKRHVTRFVCRCLVDSIYRSKNERTLVVKNQCERIFDWSICTRIAPSLIVSDCYRIHVHVELKANTSRNFIMFMLFNGTVIYIYIHTRPNIRP